MIKCFFSLSKYILWPLYVSLAILAITSLILLSGILWLSSNSGQIYIRQLINGKISNELGYKIDLEDISFYFPLNTHISHLSLSDQKGKWIEANNISVSILPTLNIFSHYIINNISAEKIKLLRKPEAPIINIAAAKDNNQNIKISVPKIELKEAIIAASIINYTQDIQTSVNGSIKWIGSEQCLSFQQTINVKNLYPNVESVQVSLAGVYLIKTGDFNAHFKNIINNNIEIEGQANLNVNSRNIYLDAKTSNLIFSELIEDSSGSVSFALEIEGSIEKPIINAKAKSSNVIYQQKNIPDITVSINGSLDNNQWFGYVELVEARNEIKASLNYLWSDQIVQFKDIDVNYMKNSIISQADVRVNLPNSLTSESINIQANLHKIEYKNFLINNTKLTALYKNKNWNITLKANDHDKVKAFFSLEEYAPLQVTLEYNLDTSSFMRMFLSADHVMQGKLVGKLIVSGTYSEPILNGQIKCNNATYRYFPFGVGLQNIYANILLQNNIFKINKLVAEDIKQNKLAINGDINFSKFDNYTYNLKISTKKFHLINHPNVHSILSTNIFIKGNNKSGSIAGLINSDNLNIYLPNEFINDIPKLNVTEVISSRVETKQVKSESFSYPIALNIDLQAKDQAFIHGWGVEAELGGRLALKGSITKPEIQGKLSSIRGRYEEFGKKFKLKKAELLFEGDIPPSPYLNIIGSITKPGLEIMPMLSGPAMNPALEIESSPAKPQEEVLSILLFDKDSSKISTFQAIQLANSLKKISTKKSSSFDPLRQVRDLFGLDDININTGDDSSSPSVGIEKHIMDNVRIKLNQGKTTDDSNAKVEIDLTPNISIESSTSMSGDNGLGINWKRDY